ncbi:MAG TPA: hypothetical protein VEG60_15670 [Candidatus Binatia bacterium]|nr:hypothetical protein [Candidatus Binatia bacterium]
MGKRSLYYYVIVATALAAAIVPIFYTATHLSDPLYRDSFLGNWAATVIGVIFGVPIALELNRRQVAAKKLRAEAEKRREESKRRKRILGLLHKEISYNKKELTKRAETTPGERLILMPGLKDGLWRAFSAGGELRWVRDPDLLDSVSNAYYYVKALIYLENQFFEAAHFPGMQIHQDKYPQDYILDYLRVIDPIALEEIDQALKVLSAALADSENSGSLSLAEPSQEGPLFSRGEA